MEDRSLKKWMHTLRKNASLSTKQIPLSKSKEWFIEDGTIVHSSKRFFSIIGVTSKNTESVLSDQQEIGTLGFLIQKDSEATHILVQAKAEPGNIKTFQYAPTCQATSSNIDQVHGGTAPLFLSHFKTSHPNSIYHSLQSEQGSRFYKKRNTNCITEISKQCEAPPTFQWTNIDNLLALTHTNYSLNTDARSVLCSAPWEKIVQRTPFTRYSDCFSKLLCASFKSNSQNTTIEKVKKNIAKIRKNSTSPTVLPLNKLHQWKTSDTEIYNIFDPAYKVIYIDVHAPGREITHWDQPIIKSSSLGSIILECGKMNTILHFGFRVLSEVGLYNHAELSPTFVKTPGSQKLDTEKSTGVIKATTYQSDEGGRFYHDHNLIQLIDIGEIDNSNTDIIWLSLQDISTLLREDGWFTNEARTALSLVLAWL